LNYIKNLKVDPVVLNNEIDRELADVKYMVRKLKNEVFLELKEYLLTIDNIFRDYIPSLTLSLLRLYCDLSIEKKDS
jgi:hypothetical protein